ncbi:MAG: glycoside hydrolase family 2 TIM barrel-domain containing protein [Novosphingobium sp.]|nr:glycoside hydrolase family 2 TIM barrel-domain containing protein [Novosphingobium sp.]
MPTRKANICTFWLLVVLAFLAGPAQAREALDLSTGWRFHFGDLTEEATRPGFDDSDWQEITVPHTWNQLGEYALKRSAETNNEQGTGWYRLNLDAPVADSGMRQYLDFAAVGTIADVWVNGTHVGTHKGAFSRFRFDVTQSWKPGATNLVVVRADNSKPAVGSSTEHVIPLAGDFFVHGGIYRQVALVTAGRVGIDLLDYGGPGVYLRADEISGDRTTIDVLTRLRIQGESLRNLLLTATIVDANGQEVARSARKLRVDEGTKNISSQLEVMNPRLWQGREDPYLYSVNVTLSEKGHELDSVTQPLGLRNFHFDAENGFFLNGKSLKLHGVSRHQDRMGKGWALSPEDHAEDMALIRELGANTVRHAHYQHAAQWSEEADKAGMIVWAELPYVAGPSLTGGKGSEQLWANAEQQLRELIRQNTNHPSIVMWSIGNEVDIAHGFGMDGAPPEPLALLKHLNAIAKQEDPSRATIFADCCESLNFKELAQGLGAGSEMTVEIGEDKLPGAADLIGYNRYFGWYYPRPFEAREMFGKHLDMLHAKYPELPMSVSEYGAGGAPSQHSDDPQTGFVNFIGRPQPEEYQAWVHEQSWPVIAERDYVFGGWVWNMFDFVSDLRGEGDSVDINTKGLVTFDRKVKKDAFYFYKAAWTVEPMIHLTGKRYAARAYPAMDVKAYSNAPSASLFFNGHEIGEVLCPNHVCVWQGVRLEPGRNEARVEAGEAGDSAVWTGPDPAKDGIRIDVGDMAVRSLGNRQFGSDTFVTGGKPMVLNLGSFGGRSAGPPRKIEAPEPALYAYWREGEAFTYEVPVPNGDWTVTLHLVEAGREPSPEQRLTVTANGSAALAPFNVAQSAGGPLKGLERSFPVSVINGILKLDFASTGGKAALAAIEITR